MILSCHCYLYDRISCPGLDIYIIDSRNLEGKLVSVNTPQKQLIIKMTSEVKTPSPQKKTTIPPKNEDDLNYEEDLKKNYTKNKDDNIVTVTVTAIVTITF